jgi:hypothetical protein
VDEEDTDTNANVITILCQTCGKNQSVFIKDFLKDMFPDWDEEKKAVSEMLKAFTNINNSGMNFSPQIEGETFESTREEAKES